MPENTSTTKEDRLWRLSRKATFAVIAIVLLVSLVILKPAAPDKITLLTGPEGSGYHEQGKRYAAYLTDLGLEAEVQITDGGFDNVKRLIAGADDAVAFAPSNIEHVVGDSVDTSHLVSLGSVAYEPLWLFYRSELEIRKIPDLAGLRVAAGAKGSVVHYVANFLFELNGIGDQVEIQPSEGQTPRTIAKALVEGQIDAAFAMGGPTSPAINNLLIDQDLGVLSFERADAYQALDPGITKLVAPQGIFDLANNIPPEDLVLLSRRRPAAAPGSIRCSRPAEDRHRRREFSECPECLAAVEARRRPLLRSRRKGALQAPPLQGNPVAQPPRVRGAAAAGAGGGARQDRSTVPQDLDLDQAHGFFQKAGRGGKITRGRRGSADAPRRVGRARSSQRDDFRPALEPPQLHRFSAVSPRHAGAGSGELRSGTIGIAIGIAIEWPDGRGPHR